MTFVQTLIDNTNHLEQVRDQTQLDTVFDNLNKKYLDYMKNAMTRVSSEEGTVKSGEGESPSFIGWRYPLDGGGVLYTDFAPVDFQTNIGKSGITQPEGYVAPLYSVSGNPYPYLTRDLVFLLWLERLTATGGPLNGIRYDVSTQLTHTFTATFSW